jgi:hypothetical protein
MAQHTAAQTEGPPLDTAYHLGQGSMFEGGVEVHGTPTAAGTGTQQVQATSKRRNHVDVYANPYRRCRIRRLPVERN